MNFKNEEENQWRIIPAEEKPIQSDMSNEKKIERGTKLYYHLKLVGDLGFQNEENREKSFVQQSNIILTTISIFSLALLYTISFNIFSVDRCRLILFLGSVGMFLLFCLYCVARAHTASHGVDMRTIHEMDKKYTKALKDGIPLEELYLVEINQIHILRRQKNDIKNRYISSAYVLLLVSLCISVLLGTIYII